LEEGSVEMSDTENTVDIVEGTPAAPPVDVYGWFVELYRGPGNPHHIKRLVNFCPPGWLELSDELKAKFDECGGYCSIVTSDVTDAEGNVSKVITNVIPDETDPRPMYKGIADAEREVAAIKQQLSNTDYKIIKAAEAQATGETTMPYDMAEVSKERQELRDKVNAAQEKADNLRKEVENYFKTATESKSSWT